MTQRVRSRCSVRGRLSSSPSDANIMLGRIGSYGRRWSQARHEVYSAVCVGSLTGVMPMRLQQTQFTTVATRLPTTVWVPNTRSTPRMTLDVPSWIAQKQLYFPARKITKPRHQRQRGPAKRLKLTSTSVHGEQHPSLLPGNGIGDACCSSYSSHASRGST
jgi:hypothetical protein